MHHHCWRILRADGDVVGFTDHDRALVPLFGAGGGLWRGVHMETDVTGPRIDPRISWGNIASLVATVLTAIAILATYDPAKRQHEPVDAVQIRKQAAAP